LRRPTHKLPVPATEKANKRPTTIGTQPSNAVLFIVVLIFRPDRLPRTLRRPSRAQLLSAARGRALHLPGLQNFTTIARAVQKLPTLQSVLSLPRRRIIVPPSWLLMVRLTFGLGLASCLAADSLTASDHYWVYVGTYTARGSKGVYRCDFDPATGKLGRAVLAAETENPSFLAVHPNGRYLYAVNEVDHGSVTAFALDTRTGALTLLNHQSSRGAAPCHLSVDRAGKHVLVANYGSGTVAVLPIGEDGRVGKATSVVQHHGSSKNPQRQEGPHAHCIVLDKANHFAFVCDLGLDKVMIYRYDADSGALTANDPPSASVKPGSGPRHMAFDPDERHAYVINEMASTVTAFDYDAQKGTLTSTQTLPTIPADFRGDTSCAEIEVHPSGKWVYGSNRGYNSIVSYAVENEGQLRLARQARQGINIPRNFAIAPQGGWVLVANQDGDSVIVFRHDKTNGSLEPTDRQIRAAVPVCLVFVKKS